MRLFVICPVMGAGYNVMSKASELLASKGSLLVDCVFAFDIAAPGARGAVTLSSAYLVEVLAYTSDPALVRRTFAEALGAMWIEYPTVKQVQEVHSVRGGAGVDDFFGTVSGALGESWISAFVGLTVTCSDDP